MVLSVSEEAINLKVGFEIHQQLATSYKLFCKCECRETENYQTLFVRKLRPTQSELGTYDSAALFEFKKMRTIKYRAAPDSSCLVEADEEPPHEINREALESALIFSLALHSKIVDEIHTMRKIVIDGSNTGGFQRTMLVANGGYLDIDGQKVGVQSICLEEDAAKLISDNGTTREYGLDRLGIPLVEIALEPVTGKPQEIMQIALTLGRLLRASKRVARGLGSIRQDVNISVNNGSIVEVKGVQRLDQLIKVIEYEMLRQHGLILIAQKLKKDSKFTEADIGQRIEDVTDILNKSSSRVVRKSLADDSSKGVLKAIRVEGFAGMIGFEPYPGIRIGKQLSELVRFYGAGGIFHSDELPDYGITSEEVNAIGRKLEAVDGQDAFVIVGGSRDSIDFVVDAIVQRLKMALDGVPAETRAATLEGKTVFSRPRAGAARMYPETDIEPVPIDKQILESLYDKIPKSWDEILNALSSRYNLNRKLAEQIFDSQYLNVFEEIADSTKISPTFIASKLTEDMVSLQRQQFDITILSKDMILDIFKRLDAGVIAKESIVLIFEKLLKKECKTVNEAIKELGIEPINEQELEMTVDKILEENISLINSKGMASLGLLMGRCMSILRGKADGKKINLLLSQKLEQLLRSKTNAKE
ncbi:MAG: Glu-tRNA(Gln) amidotransferase subunit GatE [Nitrososphaeraceae archaeon]